MSTTKPESDRPLQNSGNNVRASWPISLDNLHTNLSHCDQEAKELLISCFRWCIDDAHPITRHEFANAVDVDPTTVSRLIGGTYRNAAGERLDIPKKMVPAMRDFLRVERERFLGGEAQFVLTPTSRRIWTGCDLARESQTPVFLYGVSHIGKTWALVNYCHANNHGRTIYARMRAASGLGGMVRRINEAVGNSSKCNTDAGVQRIKRALKPNMLLILDELHLLQYTYRLNSWFACLEVLREIYDESECGMVLCGTHLFMDKAKANKHAELEQLFRRGVHKIRLPDMPTKADLAAIFEHWGLLFPEPGEEVSVRIGRKSITEHPREIVRQVSKHDGLKAVTERLRYARKLARKREEELSWRHFAEAHLKIAALAQPEADWT